MASKKSFPFEAGFIENTYLGDLTRRFRQEKKPSYYEIHLTPKEIREKKRQDDRLYLEEKEISENQGMAPEDYVPRSEIMKLRKGKKF